MEEKTTFDMLKLGSDSEIQKLIKYSQTIEELLSKKISEIDRKSIDIAEDLHQHIDDESFDIKLLDDNIWNYLDFQSFKQILRSSLFITCFSFLEIQLTATCHAIQESRQIPISIADLKGDLLERVKTYQKKLAKVPFPDNSEFWSSIITISHIRNFVVHNNGVIPLSHKNRAAVITFLKKGDLAIIEEEKFLEFSEKFNPEVLRIIQYFFDSYYKAIGI